MYAFLLTVLILDGIVLMGVVLLQSGKGGGLAAVGGGAGTDSFIGGRQAANLLTKTTWVTAGIFLTLSLVLSILSSRARAPESVLRQEFQQAPAPAPTPVLPGAQPQGTAPAQPGQTAPAQQGQAAPAQQAPAQQAPAPQQ